MKTVNVTTRSKVLNELLKMAEKTNVILKTPGGEQFILTRASSRLSFDIGYSGDDFDEEIEAARKNKQLMKFLEERGKKAKRQKRIPLAEVRRHLGL